MEDKRSSSSSCWLVIIMTLLLILPVLYVLSVGPYARIFCVGRPEPKWGPKFYAPMMYVVERSNAAQECFVWYVELWLPEEDRVIPYE